MQSVGILFLPPPKLNPVAATRMGRSSLTVRDYAVRQETQELYASDVARVL